MKLTQKRLKEILSYDPEMGVFTWKVSKGQRVKVGDIAGSLTKDGYRRIRIDSKKYLSHRLDFLYMEGYFPENQVDHIDRDKAHNKWNNLREVSRTCNMRNKSVLKSNKSGVTGVHWCKRDKKWIAQINMSKNLNLGSFANLIDAARARWEAEVKYNFPNCNTTSSAYMYLQKNKI